MADGPSKAAFFSESWSAAGAAFEMAGARARPPDRYGVDALAGWAPWGLIIRRPRRLGRGSARSGWR